MWVIGLAEREWTMSQCRFRIALVGLLLSVAMSLVGTPAAAGHVRAGRVAPADTERPAPQRTTLRVGMLPVATLLGLHVAGERAWFEEEGLALDLQTMAGGAEILPA